MILIWDVTSSADAKNYYAGCLATGTAPGRQGYYSEGQESAGRYGGKLGEELGLAGKVVDQETFERLCDNRMPFEDKPLTPRTNDFRRVLKDLTFSGPKSFSIVEAFADEDERKELRRVFDEAKEETIAQDIEPDMQCRERKDGADHDLTSGNALTASFPHLTARPENDDALPDPHYHDHTLFFNATRGPDGRILASQWGNIVRDKGYIVAAFYARLAHKLEHELGYVIDRRGGKEWEIAGVLQETIDRFSKRTAQIEAAAERLGITDAGEKAELGAKIRAKKQKELTMPELRKAWDAQLTDRERESLAAVYRREVPRGEQVTAAEAVSYAVHHVYERESVVPERELVRVALLYGLGGVTAEQVRAELPGHGVLLGEKDGRLMATTELAYAREQFITGYSRAGLGAVEAVGVAGGLSRLLADGKSLDDEQWNAVTGMLSSCDKIQLCDSAAGVGKSTMLGKFDEGMRLAGKEVTYLATTTPAVGVLRDDGFAAETVARFLLSDKMQDAVKNGHVVVDEASMLGLKDAHKLFEIAKEKNIRLIFLGDSRQHSSVAAGAFMRVLQQYGGITPYRITEIKRQVNDDHKQAVKLLFEGKTLAGFDLLDKKLGWVHEIADDGKRLEAMAREYVEALKGGMEWKKILLLSPTHAEGRQVTDAIRGMLRQEGMLGEEEHEFTRWVRADLTEAERGDGRNYKPGRVDMIEFHTKAAGHAAKSRMMVEGTAKLPLDQADRFEAYRKDSVTFSEGDILRFTGNGKSLDGHQIRNGEAYKIAGFTAKGIRLDNGWLVSKDFGFFKHGIETSFGSQAKTVSLAIVGQSSRSFAASNMEQAYVSASRSKFRVSTYTDDKDSLRQAIQRSSLKMAAHDLIHRPPKRRTWRERLGQWQRLAMLERNRADAAAVRQPQQERQISHGYGR